MTSYKTMEMLSKIRDRIDQWLPGNPASKAGGDRKDRPLDQVVAVLMLEISIADQQQQEEERNLILQLLREQFSLTEEQLRELFEVAQGLHTDAVCMREFTAALNDRLEVGARADLIGKLWRIAGADQVIDKHEEHRIRKISDLLYVPHADYIKAKQSALGTG